MHGKKTWREIGATARPSTFLNSGVTSRLPFSRYGTPCSIQSGFGASLKK